MQETTVKSPALPNFASGKQARELQNVADRRSLRWTTRFVEVDKTHARRRSAVERLAQALARLLRSVG